MPKVSVVVPIFGVEQYIERCYESLLAQTFHDFEIVFVNDGSRDRSAEILLRIMAQERAASIPTLYVVHEHNRGISATRETGLGAATGTYVLYVDSDDYLAPQALDRLVTVADQSHADIVFCDFFELKNGIVSTISQRVQSMEPQQVAAAMLREEIVWCPWNKLFRRALASLHGIRWPVDVNVGEDLVFMTALIVSAQQIAYVDQPLYYYNRDNVGSYINSWKPSSAEQNRKAVEAVDQFLRGSPVHRILSDAFTMTKLMARFQMLYTFDSAQARIAASLFAETNDRIFSYLRTPLYWRLALYLLAHNRNWTAKTVLAGIKLLRRSRRTLSSNSFVRTRAIRSSGGHG